MERSVEKDESRSVSYKQSKLASYLKQDKLRKAIEDTTLLSEKIARLADILDMIDKGCRVALELDGWSDVRFSLYRELELHQKEAREIVSGINLAIHPWELDR